MRMRDPADGFFPPTPQSAFPMIHAKTRIVALLGCFVLSLATMPASGAETPAAPHDPTALEFFEKEVRPVLVRRCAKCHGAGDEEPEGSLRVDSLAALLAGGDTGPAIVPGDPEESLLIDAINYGEIYQMPPKSKMPAEEIAALTRWVEIGAPWPADEAPAAAVTKAKFDWQTRRDEHWAWRPIERPAAPPVAGQAWPQSDIDRFILAQLESHGLSPASEADRRVLVRRLYFDLIGLPPTAEEVDRFVNDSADDAYEHLVDELLQSPHFGEKWARHWLDLVRYGETRGHEFEPLVPNAYQYRDYLIRALNADLPYDQFVREHLAGDLLTEPRLNPDQRFNESILGTGFWFLGEEVHSPVDIRKDETDRLDNRLDVMAKTFLGLTVACARCHDHKFDAISQSDYYALSGFLLSSTYRQVRFESLERNRQVAEQLDALQRQASEKTLAHVAQTRRDVLARSADYLRAAAELISAKADPQSVAKQSGLDSTLLAQWVEELKQARADAGHPLQGFALCATDPQATEGEGFARRFQSLRGELQKHREAAQVIEQVVLDFGAAGKADFRADGFTFGLHPLRPGDAILSANPAQPLLEITTYATARRDPLWNVLKPAAGNETDHGSLGNWQRPGRTLCTPKVTLHSGKIWCLARGSFHSYGAVDSHLIVAGPLHGRLLHAANTKDDQWRWTGHDLSAYAGERVHLEFTPRSNDDELQIAKVVESPVPPPLPLKRNALVDLLLFDESIVDRSALAEAYQRLFSQVAQAMAAGDVASLAEPEAAASLARWMQERTELFTAEAGKTDQELVQLLAPLVEQRRAVAQTIQAESHTALAMLDLNGVDEHVLLRGLYRTPGEVAPRRFLMALGGAAGDGYGSGSGRLQLVEQMLADDNPFVARVLVNRVWHHLFGRGIVPTVDNFGVLGQPPTHPELLDYLADRFRREQGWSIKTLIKSLVLTSTYRMSSAATPEALAIDPANLWLARARVRRLPAEAIRDSLLAVSGRLDRQLLGPPVEVHLTSFMQGRGRPGRSGPLDGDGRRSIYTRVRRNFLPPMMLAFDMPIPFNSFGRRALSNVPGQALILLNDPLVIQQAKLWSERTRARSSATTDRIAAMYLDAFARSPSAAELAAAQEFLIQQAERYGASAEQAADHPQAWADLAHVLINSKEFIFLR
ncbi:MAG: PSD1 domain-containing protein [Planctomycetales bacterium]|nr:PSD1 domain-containing protein [Planctomycetales bacterium]